MDNLIKTRIDLLKKMHKNIIEIGDEDIYYYWITEAVPDEPDEDIFEFIASHDSQWLNCCKAFYNIQTREEEEEYGDEPGDIDSDVGFDPYMGCYTDDV